MACQSQYTKMRYIKLVKSEKTHRLPDVYVSIDEMGSFAKAALDLTLLQEGSYPFKNTAELLSSNLARKLAEINHMKPNKRFIWCPRFDLFQVEMSAVCSNHHRYIDIKFMTNWRFYANHQP